jgi:hypothetical protein
MEHLERISCYFISHTGGKIAKIYVARPERGKMKKEKRPAYTQNIRIKTILENRGTEVGERGEINTRIENGKPVK